MNWVSSKCPKNCDASYGCNNLPLRLEFYKILKISQLKYEVFHFLEYFGAGKHNPLNVSILLERKCIYHVSGILATHNSWLLEWRKKLFEGLIDTN